MDTKNTGTDTEKKPPETNPPASKEQEVKATEPKQS
jgi:hypothetical protein